MKYTIIKAKRAGEVGIMSTHRTSKDSTMIIVNENEVKSNPLIEGGTLEERCEYIGGEVLSLSELNNIINKGGW